MFDTHHTYRPFINTYKHINTHTATLYTATLYTATLYTDNMEANTTNAENMAYNFDFSDYDVLSPQHQAQCEKKKSEKSSLDINTWCRQWFITEVQEPMLATKTSNKLRDRLIEMQRRLETVQFRFKMHSIA